MTNRPAWENQKKRNHRTDRTNRTNRTTRAYRTNGNKWKKKT